MILAMRNKDETMLNTNRSTGTATEGAARA